MGVSHFPMAATYASLLALARSLREIRDLQQCVDPLHKKIILSLHEKVDFIVTFFEDYSDKHQGTLDFVGNGIREAAYEAQDFMDSYLCWVSTTDHDDGSSSSEAKGDEVNLDGDLTMASEKIDFILGEAMKMKNNDAAQDLRSLSYSSTVDSLSTVQATAKNMVVGFDDDLNSIKERLYEDSAELQIIPIFGMGGIGKTTLATRAYEDSIFSQYFDTRAWITVSQEYQRREILSGLFKSLKNQESDKSEAELAKLVYQNLLGRRYLIVIDDMWSTEAWDDLKMIFPDDGNGSRILLTTRLLDVASYAGSSDFPIHQMSFIDEDQSWELLQQRVFGQQSCPLQLVEVGKKIAKNCGGLPLTIVVVAGLLLSSGNTAMREEVWENISENISAREPTIALQCSKILCFSYDRLPLRLKTCFLYIAAFPEDSEIDVSMLIKLWVAEGFLKPNDGFKCLEDVGERYLDDLVKRSLLLVRKKWPAGILESVGVHDMLREICITKAEEEGFLHRRRVSSKTDSRTEFLEDPYRRRLTFQITKGNQEWEILDSSVRSILIFPKDYYIPRLYVESRHMCVLDAPRLGRTTVSHIISTFHNLRYFHMSMCEGFPASISKLANLETLVVSDNGSALELPCEILKIPKLRHLIFPKGVRLSNYPSDMGIVHESDLQTIETVIDFVFAEEITRILVNLKKLKATYNMPGRDWDDFSLDNLSNLRNLEHLEITMQDQDRDWCHPSMRWNHAFPMALKKLSLEGVPLPWENMTIIGSLPNLQVLQMVSNCDTEFSEWTTVEGEFLQLKCFYTSLDHVVKWETEKEHFPCLETLILDSVELIDEIPIGIGEIDTLQYIELWGCKKSMEDSAEQIEKHQHENGNDVFRVRVNH
ncbi:putative late blight resistance protein homolog R1A-3 [Henckelia pumila]|uniref:putative late blight resistance protein homolog R1A-3 n=1 Tax=Henckelia pumila TaxID=405737 RepID=UPI003C6DD1F2